MAKDPRNFAYGIWWIHQDGEFIPDPDQTDGTETIRAEAERLD